MRTLWSPTNRPLKINSLIYQIYIPKFLTRNLYRWRVLAESVGRTLSLNSSAARCLFRVRFCRQLNWPHLSLCASFAASCDGQTFGNDKDWKVTRCDDVKVQNLLVQFLLNSVQKLWSYHAPSFSVAAWRLTRRNFWPATFWCSLLLLYKVKVYSAFTNLNGFWVPKLWQWQRHKRPMQNLAWRTEFIVFASFDTHPWTILQNTARRIFYQNFLVTMKASSHQQGLGMSAFMCRKRSKSLHRRIMQKSRVGRTVYTWMYT